MFPSVSMNTLFWYILCFLKVDFALEEISYLQYHGPSVEDVSAILEIEQRAHENGLQVCITLYCFLLQMVHYCIFKIFLTFCRKIITGWIEYCAAISHAHILVMSALHLR